jgi:GH25 family lysozyme M1 (1,4-beta-N-acetylmuramidase)
MVYTYTSYANTELDMDKLSMFDLWLADYRGTRPTRKHGMWQYTSTGSVAGISGGVDLSHAYKDYPAIIQKAKLTGA